MSIDKIRAALLAEESETGKSREALTALAELERATAEPVGTVLGAVVEWTGEKPVVGTKLYTTPPPAPVAEMREPTPEECRQILAEFATPTWYSPEETGREMFRAVRAVMWPKSEEL